MGCQQLAPSLDRAADCKGEEGLVPSMSSSSTKIGQKLYRGGFHMHVAPCWQVSRFLGPLPSM